METTLTRRVQFVDRDGRLHIGYTRQGGALYRGVGGGQALLEIPCRSRYEVERLAKLMRDRANALGDMS